MLFTATIKRQDGTLAVHIQSEAMEAMMKSLSAEKKAAVVWTDGVIEGAGVETQFQQVTRWDVKASKLQQAIQACGVATALGTELLIGPEGSVINLVPLTLKGLGTGLTIKPAIPYPVEQLKKFAKNLTDVANALLTSVQPVLITVNVKAAGEENNGAPTRR